MPNMTVEVQQIITKLKLIDFAIASTASLPNPDRFDAKAKSLIILRDFRNKGLYTGEVSSTEDDILHAFGRAIELNPNNSEYLLDRGLFYADLGKNDWAMADYLKAESMPLPEDAFLQLVVTGLQKKLQAKLTPPNIPVPSTVPDTEQASSTKVSSVSMFSTEQKTVVTSRNEHEIEAVQRSIKSNDRAIARRSPSQAVDLFCSNGREYVRLAKLTNDNGLLKTAIESYTMAIQHCPDNPDYIIYRAPAYMLNGDVYHALKDILLANKLPENDPLQRAAYSIEIKKIIAEIKSKKENEAVQLAIKQLESEDSQLSSNPNWLDELSFHFEQSTTPAFAR